MVLLSGVDNRLRRASHPPAPDTASVRPTRLREPRYVRLSLLGRGCDTVARGSLAGCPSGQRERSVKPSAMPTVVRIHYPPPPRRPRRFRRSQRLSRTDRTAVFVLR